MFMAAVQGVAAQVSFQQCSVKRNNEFSAKIDV